MTNCGASSESCCTSLEVTGANGFYRTYTNSGTGPTGEADPADVSTFELDKYEVTVGRFRQFVSAWNAGYTPPAGSGKHTHLNGGKGLADSGNTGSYETGWLATDDANLAPTDANLLSDTGYATWTTSPGSQENLPINDVNWYEAYAFCIWDGGFLPSQSEGEYAAAGGAEQREYPWGSAAPGTGNQYAIYDCDYPSGSGICVGVSNFAAVGRAPLGAGAWGQLDLAGDVYVWLLDWYAPYVDPCADCAYLTSVANCGGAPCRVDRGGDFHDPASSDLLAAFYGMGLPTGRSRFTGIRCARTP
jgi:formylglycine-generating enzyme required for sulfatase activity